MTKMRIALAKSYTDAKEGQTSVNIVLVDWKDGAAKGGNIISLASSYAVAGANTRLVGKQVAVLIDSLEKQFDTDLRKRTRIIGFSLGGQAAGNAGMYFNEIQSKRKVSGSCQNNHREI